MKKIFLLGLTIGIFCLCINFSAYAASYFIFDDYGGTWHDANKKGTDDINLCWAAAASNSLVWSGWNYGTGFNNEYDIFSHYKNHWTDEVGNTRIGMRWWFDGVNEGEGTYMSQIDVPGGGDFWTPPYDFYNYLERWQDYDDSDNSLSLPKIEEYLHKGYGVSIGIYTSEWGHYINAWGYEYNEHGDIIGIYVTDGANPYTGLEYFEVLLEGDGYWHILNYHDYEPLIGKVDGLDQRPVNPPCEGDFEPDGDVDGSDLAVFAADFGRTDCSSGPTCEGDFDTDGDVDGSDLAVFAADFGRTDCPTSE